jgi:hypothetical protein
MALPISAGAHSGTDDKTCNRGRNIVDQSEVDLTIALRGFESLWLTALDTCLILLVPCVEPST